jgi:peptidoglycan/LPS O-acetylase OafA/YrhL
MAAQPPVLTPPRRPRRPSSPTSVGGPGMSSSAPRLPYRPGVDGLRTVAVGAVFLYHGQVGWTPGGFLGVDIFLVISGYLITSLLLAERRKTGDISLPRFWLRRARRLLPAAFLVIFVCLLLGAIFFREQLDTLRNDALASVAYVMNWRQIFAHHSYFEAFQRPSLLRHFWTLSLEEQFYLLWPAVLVLALATTRRTRVMAGLGVAALISTILMAVLFKPGADPSRVYYGTDTHAMGLLVGALLAFVWAPDRLRKEVGRHAGAALNIAGTGALVILLLIIGRTTDFAPWMYHGGFLVVSLVTAVLLAVLMHPAARLGVILGCAPMRWLGVRSYGIYLWHWPVIAVTRPNIDLHWSPWVLVPFQAAIAVGLASLSYKYVEMPIRRGQAIPWIRARMRALEPGQRTLAAGGTVAVLIALIAFVSLQTPVSPPSASAAIPGAPDAAPPVTKKQISRLPAPKHGNILAVGESVMLGAASSLEDTLGQKRLRIDAAVGRQADDIIGTLEAYKQSSGLPSRVVVQIGDNGPILGDEPQRLKDVLKGVQRVVLVTVHIPQSWQDPNNKILTDLVKHWPEARLADWNAVATQHPDWLNDGVHPSQPGIDEYVRLINQALKSD